MTKVIEIILFIRYIRKPFPQLADFHFLSWLDFVSSVGRFVILHHEKRLPMQQISLEYGISYYIT